MVPPDLLDWGAPMARMNFANLPSNVPTLPVRDTAQGGKLGGLDTGIGSPKGDGQPANVGFTGATLGTPAVRDGGGFFDLAALGAGAGTAKGGDLGGSTDTFDIPRRYCGTDGDTSSLPAEKLQELLSDWQAAETRADRADVVREAMEYMGNDISDLRAELGFGQHSYTFNGTDWAFG